MLWSSQWARTNFKLDNQRNVNHMPGQRYYEATVVHWWRGERWFRNETDAQAARLAARQKLTAAPSSTTCLLGRLSAVAQCLPLALPVDPSPEDGSLPPAA